MQLWIHYTPLNCTLNGWTAKYVGYISIKLLPKNIHQQKQKNQTRHADFLPDCWWRLTVSHPNYHHSLLEQHSNFHFVAQLKDFISQFPLQLGRAMYKALAYEM